VYLEGSSGFESKFKYTYNSFIGMLEIIDVVVEVETNEGPRRVVNGVSLSVKPGEVHAVMGPNGSGKTSLLYAIAGHPSYRLVSGDIRLDGESIADLSPDKRSLKGIFLSFQNPREVPGVKLSTLILAMHNKRAGVQDLLKVQNPKLILEARRRAQRLGLGSEVLRRDVNVGFSGGERKRSEVLQAVLIKPRYMLLDEPDSGLDIDGVKAVASVISESAKNGSGVLLVTHYARILNFVKPDKVTIIVDGKVAATGGPELADLVEREGYARFGGPNSRSTS
jgi:Fe-S cluster assembly ATP-binding protein